MLRKYTESFSNIFITNWFNMSKLGIFDFTEFSQQILNMLLLENCTHFEEHENTEHCKGEENVSMNLLYIHVFQQACWTAVGMCHCFSSEKLHCILSFTRMCDVLFLEIHALCSIWHSNWEKYQATHAFLCDGQYSSFVGLSFEYCILSRGKEMEAIVLAGKGRWDDS